MALEAQYLSFETRLQLNRAYQVGTGATKIERRGDFFSVPRASFSLQDKKTPRYNLEVLLLNHDLVMKKNSLLLHQQKDLMGRREPTPTI